MRSLLGRFHRPMSRGVMGDMLTMNSLGDGSTLNLDFTTGVLDSRLTFTRSTTATYINSSGYVTSAAINEPRFDYSPTNIGEPRGLLIEGQAANLCTYSNDFENANWTRDGATNPVPSTVSQTGPDGAATVVRITFDKTGGAFSRIRRAVSVSNGTYIMSVWMKANTANGAASTQNIGLRLGSSAGVNCVVTTTWQRFTHTFAVTDGSAEFQIMLWDNITGPPANDETADVLVYGAQTELGSGASSYIPTGASQVTRNADDCTITGTNFSSWWPLSQSTFTVYWDGDITRSPANTQFYWLTRAGGSSRSRGYVTTGSLIRANNTAYDFTLSPTTSMTVGTRFKSAVAISSGSSAMYANNSTVIGSDTSAGAVTLFDADSLNFNVNADNFMHIRALKFYPSRLANTQLQALVT